MILWRLLNVGWSKILAFFGILLVAILYLWNSILRNKAESSLDNANQEIEMYEQSHDAQDIINDANHTADDIINNAENITDNIIGSDNGAFIADDLGSLFNSGLPRKD